MAHFFFNITIIPVFIEEKIKMLRLFKKKSKRSQLEKKYRRLLEESYRLSHTDRKLSDLKRAEAEEVLRQIENLDH